MYKNNDGTVICQETAIEILDERFAASDFPRINDLLGSDWVVHLGPLFPRNPQEYRTEAYKLARRRYAPM